MAKRTPTNEWANAMPVQGYKDTYEDIIRLYDFAEELIESVDDSRVEKNKEEQLAIVNGLIEAIEESTDILAEEFCEIIENNGKPKTKKKGKLESAFRKMFVAIDAYKEAVEQSAIKLKGDIMNVADPIVQKLTQHIEHVVALFLEYVAISVDLFMHKTQIEEMKKRERHVADLLHKHAMGQA
ncbi:MAG: hypothetical protein IT567_07295 [Alphaproteobacteria bacterium]|nr:hypothetical protein [Alphaproteobacteria bacterium]